MNNEVDNNGGSRSEEAKKGCRRVLELIGSWVVHKDKKEDNWLQQMRGNLGLIATIITTMTFQTVINPPGGVRLAKDHGDLKCTRKNETQHFQCPGDAVLAVVHPSEYLLFIYTNTISFISAISVLFLLVSGIRLNHGFSIGILSIRMCVTLTSLIVTYRTALEMLTPDDIWGEEKRLIKLLHIISAGMLLLMALFVTLRITIWGVNVYRKRKMSITSKTPRENTPPA